MEHYASKTQRYESIARRLESLLGDERDFLANTANTTAVLYDQVGDVNWAGFYFLRGDELVLGPFQGRVACVRIQSGSGVCGTAASRAETIVVENVHQFDGHIACDAASNAEIVVPLFARGELIGVLDVDSPTLGRFDDEDRKGIEELARIWMQSTDLDGLCSSLAGT